MYVCQKYVCTYYFRMLSKKIKVLRPLKAMPLIRKREKQGLSLECHHKVFTAVTYMAKLFPLDILKSTFSIIYLYKLKKSSNVLYLDGGTFNYVIWFFQVIVQLLCHWNFNYQILSNKKRLQHLKSSKGYEAFFKTFSHQIAAAAATLKVNFFENPRPFSPLGLKISPSTTHYHKRILYLEHPAQKSLNISSSYFFLVFP